MQRLMRLGALSLLVTFFGAGCFGGTTTTTTGPDGGVFRTTTDVFAPKVESVEWKHMKVLNLGTKFGSIENLGVTTGAVDPQDPLTMYIGSSENGLLYTYDGGESWMQAKGLTTGRVAAIGVDPKNKCVVYVAQANRLLKTDNCLRDFNQAFFDGRPNVRFNTVAIDPTATNIVYAGTSGGDIYRSDNAGGTWKQVHRVQDIAINYIAIDPKNHDVLYAATQGVGLLKSTDGGKSWTAIRKEFQDFDKARFARMIIPDPNITNRLYHISQYGILRSDDGGISWNSLVLASPNNALDVIALAIHPKDSNKFAYATPTSIVFTSDGGTTWNSRKPPTARGISFMTFAGGTGEGGMALYIAALPTKK